MLLIIALIFTGLIAGCKPTQQPTPPEEPGSQGDETIPFRLSSIIRGVDKTDVEFWNDGLSQYFDGITEWSKNESGTISMSFDLTVNSTSYFTDVVFSYTTTNNIKRCNATLSITNGIDSYDVVIKDNAIFYMLDGYNAVESDVESLSSLTDALPFGKGSLFGLGTLMTGIKADETVYYGKSIGGSATKAEYLSQVKFKETVDAIDRHLSDDAKSIALDFINDSFSTTLTSLSKDDNQIDAQFPSLDVKMGYIATILQGSSINNSPEEVYFSLKADTSNKPAFMGQAQDILLVFKTNYKTLQYTQTYQDVLPLDTSNFVTFSKESMTSSVSNGGVEATVTLLRNVLDLIATE